MNPSFLSRALAAIGATCILAACPPSTPAPTDGSPDGIDAAPLDATDAAMDAAPTRMIRPRPGCNPTTGIHCDGNWPGQCTPACDPSQCCSPQRGVFQCVPPDSNGYCPAGDISVDPERIAGQWFVQWRYFAADSCATVERCVNGSGWRRLLRFETWTPNRGTADLYLGAPDTTNPNFVFSPCHNHWHFDTYASYELRATTGSPDAGADAGVAATGHKQAFCLEDTYRYPGMNATGIHYVCENQGIQIGWQDVYDSSLDCQWIDVTGVAPGPYTLHIALNTSHILNETNYDNNSTDVPVTIPPADVVVDPTQACSPDNPTGFVDIGRECGWTREGTHTCLPGARVAVGCDAACSLGSCSGDTQIRICDGAAMCDVRTAYASNDDSGCGTALCGDPNGDCCSRAQFICPNSGMYTVLWSAHDATDPTVTCSIAIR